MEAPVNVKWTHPTVLDDWNVSGHQPFNSCSKFLSVFSTLFSLLANFSAVD